MAATDLTTQARGRPWLGSPRRLQIATLATILVAWEFVGASGLVYRGVVPSVVAIAAAFAGLLVSQAFWSNFAVTLFEVVLALSIGSTIGILFGLLVGASRLSAAAFEPLINCVASTPKVIFLPVLYLVFGIGVGSKIAVGALACFFPVAISVIAAMLQLNPVLVRVGRSFGLPWWRMVEKIYLPSLVEPIGNGLRIAIGVAIAVCLIAETRMSYAGLGYMVVDSFNRSRFAVVYAVLIVIVGLAVLANAGIPRRGWRRR